MAIFSRNLYIQRFSHERVIGGVINHNDVYSSDPLLVRRKASSTPSVLKTKDCSCCNINLVAYLCLFVSTSCFRFVWAWCLREKTNLLGIPN